MFILVMINTIVITLADFVYPYVTRWATNTVIYETIHVALKHIFQIGLILTGLWILSIVTSRIGTYNLIMCDRICSSVEEKLFEKYENLPSSYYDDNNVGSAMSIMDGDVNRLYELLFIIPTSIVGIVLSIIGCCIVFSNINVKLFAIFIPLVPIRLLYEFKIMKKLQALFKENREMCRDKYSFIEDRLCGVRTTIAFSQQDSEIQKFGVHIRKILDSDRRKWIWSWARDLGADTFSTIYYLFIHVFGLYLTIKGEMPIADLVVFYMYSYMIINPFENLSHMNKVIREGLVSYEKIDEVLNTDPEIIDYGKGNVPNLTGDIEFRNVSFQYKSSKSDILNHLNLHIPKGQFIAIVGPSGGGKSTIAGLLARFYEVSNGNILIDGIDIKDIDLHYLRRQVGVLQQNTYLYNGTILDNIRYGAEDVSMEEVYQACRFANADEFIEALPNKYDSKIGEKGVKLSGGQKQRIAIARLFLINPKILIFDEATSSLDNMSESLIQESLRNVSKGRTTIVIAHRLSTIRNADRIIYLSKDGIQEDGTHEELMMQKGEYYKMYQQNQDRIDI